MKSNKFWVLFLLLLAFLSFGFAEAAQAAVGNTSPKKGAGSTWGWPEEVTRAVGVSWGYDWYINETAFNQSVYEHVPMVRSGDVPSRLDRIKEVARAHPGRNWLVFNEPDWSEQDNITPAAGADLYYQLRIAIKEADPSADSSWAVSAYGGSIIPSGDVAVAVGASQTFTITPNAGFRIAEVKVDEVSAGAISSKTFTNVMSNHVIAASFVATSYSLSIA